MMQNAECDDALALGSWLGTDADAGKYGAHDGESATFNCQLPYSQNCKFAGQYYTIAYAVYVWAKYE